MKYYKNHLLAGSGAAILLVSFVLSAPRAPQGSNSKLGRTNEASRGCQNVRRAGARDR